MKYGALLAINETYLKEDLESSTKKRSTIVIIIGISKKAIKLCLKKLRFGDALKIIKKY